MKTAYSLITLETIDKIFNEKAEIKVSSMSKMLYINILLWHFKDKGISQEDLMGFDLFYSDIKNYTRWEQNLKELHEAKLVLLTDHYITFINVWGTYIDRTLLIKPIENKKGILDYKQEIVSNQSLLELTSMRFKWSKITFHKAIDLFFLEQEALSTQYDQSSDCTKHFINWCNINSSKINQTNNGSQNKILGL